MDTGSTRELMVRQFTDHPLILVGCVGGMVAGSCTPPRHAAVVDCGPAMPCGSPTPLIQSARLQSSADGRLTVNSRADRRGKEQFRVRLLAPQGGHLVTDRISPATTVTVR
ncbi:hypothetical protein P3T35_007497 [Kitasatospora sp. GP30]|nr:hypothetical protein [Kitasatospora sp. GP30]